jgi:hypothetical protein
VALFRRDLPRADWRSRHRHRRPAAEPAEKCACSAEPTHAPFDETHLALLEQSAPPIELLLRLQHAQTQLEQRERALGWLSRLPKRLGADLSLQHALETVESLMRKVAPEGGGVWLYDENRRALLLATQYGGDALPEQIAPNELPPNWTDAPVETVWGGRRYRAYALALAEQPLGLLALALPADAPDALEWLPPLLGHIALTLSNALLYEQTAQRAQHMAKLYDLSLQLGETQSLRAVLRLLCRTAHELIPHDYTVVYLPSRREPDRLAPVYVEPLSETLLAHSPDAQYSLPGWVYAFNAPIAAPDLEQHPQNLKEPLPGRFASALAAPLQVAERTLGVDSAAYDHPTRVHPVGSGAAVHPCEHRRAAPAHAGAHACVSRPSAPPSSRPTSPAASSTTGRT